MNRIILTFIITLITSALSAARIDTVFVKSKIMNKNIQVVFITPGNSNQITSSQYPTIYLLHGYGNDAKYWLKVKPELPQIADKEGIIFVCPDGKNSWYWDSPKDTTSKYETFISHELIQYTDTHYNTIPHREGRAITGLSMGGQGALWNAFRNKDIFGAAGSTSGGVDIRPFPQNWDIKLLLGEYSQNKRIWDTHTIINQIHHIANKELSLIIDCGQDDFFINVNKALHNQLLKQGIEHDFIIRPGEHNYIYWRNSIDYQILFFTKYFKKYRCN